MKISKKFAGLNDLQKQILGDVFVSRLGLLSCDELVSHLQNDNDEFLALFSPADPCLDDDDDDVEFLEFYEFYLVTGNAMMLAQIPGDQVRRHATLPAPVVCRAISGQSVKMDHNIQLAAYSYFSSGGLTDSEFSRFIAAGKRLND